MMNMTPDILFYPDKDFVEVWRVVPLPNGETERTPYLDGTRAYVKTQLLATSDPRAPGLGPHLSSADRETRQDLEREKEFARRALFILLKEGRSDNPHEPPLLLPDPPSLTPMKR